jgi:hypothetical protein
MQRATLAAVRAMLGEITPAMRVATIDAAPGRIVLRVYHEGDASEELREDLDAVVTEILAEFTSDAEIPEVDLVLARRDEPGPILVDGWPILARKGTEAYHAEQAQLYEK